MLEKIEKAWVAHELPGYREDPNHPTYMGWDCDELPPVPSYVQSTNFDWLMEKPEHENASDEKGKAYRNEKIVTWEGLYESHLPPILKSVKDLELSIPDSYLCFLKNTQLLSRLYSCTGCYFVFPGDLPSVIDADGSRLILFLQDYQGCAYWYLWLLPNGDYGIVVTDQSFGGELDESGEEADYEIPFLEQLCLVEKNFESFIYRFWVENQIWYDLCVRETALSGEPLAYAEHYLK